VIYFTKSYHTCYCSFCKKFVNYFLFFSLSRNTSSLHKLPLTSLISLIFSDPKYLPSKNADGFEAIVAAHGGVADVAGHGGGGGGVKGGVDS
jgi:hypothetical protein